MRRRRTSPDPPRVPRRRAFTQSERLALLEDDVAEIKTFLQSIKRYVLWVLFGLIVPVVQALGVETTDIFDIFRP